MEKKIVIDKDFVKKIIYHFFFLEERIYHNRLTNLNISKNIIMENY